MNCGVLTAIALQLDTKAWIRSALSGRSITPDLGLSLAAMLTFVCVGALCTAVADYCSVTTFPTLGTDLQCGKLGAGFYFIYWLVF